MPSLVSNGDNFLQIRLGKKVRFNLEYNDETNKEKMFNRHQQTTHNDTFGENLNSDGEMTMWSSNESPFFQKKFDKTIYRKA